jgi:hypothetical protein
VPGVVFLCRVPLELPMRDAGGKAEQGSALLAERSGSRNRPKLRKLQGQDQNISKPKSHQFVIH